jgi:hypothetical protein
MLNHAATQLTRSTESIAHDVSAETRKPNAGSSEPNAESSRSDSEFGSSNVSAETHEQHSESSGSDSESRSSNISAEASWWDSEPGSKRVSAETRTPSLAMPAVTATCGSNSESGDGQADKSLLDRLLDEAELLRAARATSDSEQSAGGSETRPWSQVGVLHTRADAVRRAFNRADALVALAQGYLRGDRPNRSPIEVTLTIPASSLRATTTHPIGASHPIAALELVGGLHPIEVGALGESFVSIEAARRLSCDCGVVEIIEDDHGVPLSVGRKRRTISGQLKRALRERDKTCTFPGCTNRLFLEAHHIKHWADGGETSLNNASVLCTSHHHYVHEYGYTIELDPDKRSQFRDPHGRLVVAVPDRPVRPEIGWPRIRAENEHLRINADTNACKWDGNPVDYGAVIGYLVTADGLN